MAKSPAEASNGRKIVDAAFARRLEQVCDAHPHVPPLHSGRLMWVQRNLKDRFEMDVSVETVRKWFAGEARPRPAKMEKLAQLLEVDPAWLAMGVDQHFTPRERLARNAMVDGAVNVVAGLIQMDGGIPAFPADDDTGAQEKNIDLHAIIRGGKFDINVTLGAQLEDGRLRFMAPVKYDAIVVLGLIREGFGFRIFELSPEVIAAGHRHGVTIEVAAEPSELREIESFRQRL